MALYVKTGYWVRGYAFNELPRLILGIRKSPTYITQNKRTPNTQTRTRT